MRKYQDICMKNKKVLWILNAKIVNFEKVDNKDQIRYGEVNGFYKRGTHRLHLLGNVIVVAFYSTAKNSEHGDTKLVQLKLTETWLLRPFQRQTNRF